VTNGYAISRIVINGKSLHNPKPMAAVTVAYVVGHTVVDTWGE
jgi:hypothetical protein